MTALGRSVVGTKSGAMVFEAWLATALMWYADGARRMPMR